MNQLTLADQVPSSEPDKPFKIKGFPNIKDGVIEGREYQVSIAEKCAGKNYLVSIPTGLGKTIIGVLVAGKTLELYPDNSKIIMLAPTKPLIVQHAKSFAEFFTIDIPQEDPVMTGAIKHEKRVKYFEERKVLFYTPQTLRNDLLEKRYDLKNVSLIIFDEAHRASGDYAYCQIANIYNESNPDGNTLALTASPGSNKEKIETLCSNLYIPFNNIELRVRTDDDVKKYIKKMHLFKIGVKKTALMDEILKSLKIVLQNKLRALHSLGYLKKRNGEPITDTKDLEGIMQIQLVEINRDLIRIIGNSTNKRDLDKGIFGAVSINAEALKVFHMIKTVESQGPNILLEYLDKLQKEARKENSSKATKKLNQNPIIRRMYITLNNFRETRPNKLFHPKLFKLIRILKDEFNENPNSKILLFTELRNTVMVLTKHLKNFSPFKPVKFVGQSKKSEKDKGLSQKKQIEYLEDFKAGKYNILVSTSVAEEGLDIDECDLVIFYDAVPSEIRLIQRRGRTARKREGKVIILYCLDTSDEIYLNISMAKLRAMQKSLGGSPRKKSNTKPKNQKKLSVTLDVTKNRELKMEKIDISHSKEINDFMEAVNRESNRKSNGKNDNIQNIEKKEKIVKKKERKEEQPPKIEEIEQDIEILIDRNLPVKYGLRRSIKFDPKIIDIKEKYSHKFGEFCPNLIIGNKLAINILKKGEIRHILQSLNNDDSKRNSLLGHIFNLKSEFEVILVFADFIGWDMEQMAEKRRIMKEMQILDEMFDIYIIPADNPEEIHQIINPTIQNIISK
ncbi:MAG: DEAD/DEAH box helicase [Promethearchaeota archaeon]